MTNSNNMSYGVTSLGVHPIPMPTDIVHRNESVFSGTSSLKWNEIVRLRVLEDGWSTLKQIADNGPAPYVSTLKESFNPNNNPLINVEENKGYIDQKNTILFERFPNFLNSLCPDGIILQDDKNLGIKIVAIREDKNHRNYYRVFSNRRVQCEEIFGMDIYNKKSFDNYLLGCLGYDFIGINGLINALSNKKNILEANLSYMLFSLTTELTKHKCNTDSSYQITSAAELAEKYKSVFPGVFSISDKINAYNGQLEPLNGRLYINDENSVSLPLESTKSFLDMYEDLVEIELKKASKKNDAQKKEKDNEK